MPTRPIDPSPPPALFDRGLAVALRDAVILSLVCTGLGLAVNAWFHPRGIPLVAEKEYEILVPCPEPGGEVTPMPSGDARLSAPETVLVDARPAAPFASWHLDGAINVSYDYLDPTPPHVLSSLARRIASSRAQRVVVYGDGDDPDSGEQLAREISATGIRHVFFVQGGAPAMQPGREGAP